MRRKSVVGLLIVAGLGAAVATASPVAKLYRDPLGDAEPGHGDIAGVAVSDTNGAVTLKVDIRHLRDTGVVELATREVARSDHVLSFWRGGWKLERELAPHNTLVDVSHLRGVSFSSKGHIYTFQFGPAVLRGVRRFFFEVHIDTPTIGDVSDWAPDGPYDSPSGWWKYTVSSAKH